MALLITHVDFHILNMTVVIIDNVYVYKGEVSWRRIHTLRRVRLIIVREIMDTNIDMEGDDTKYTLKCI